MKKAIIKSLSAALVLAVLLAGCGATAPASTAPAAPASTAPAAAESTPPADTPAADAVPTVTENTFLAIAGASQGGSNYVQASGMAKLIDQYVENVSATVEATGGSVENAKLVGSGQDQLGFVMADIARAGYNGEEPFEEALPDLRVAIVGQGAYLHFVVRADSDIQTIEDFAGRRIAVGAPGSSSAAVMVPAVLAAYGLSYDDVDEYFLGQAETSSALQDQTVDIGVFYAGMPVSAVSEVATSYDIRLISIDEAHFTSLLGNYPYFHQGTVLGGTYPGIDGDTPVLGVYCTVSVNANVPDNVVYHILKAVHEHQDEWAEIHPGAGEFVPELTAQQYTNFLPLHPGAEMYLKEVGLL